MCTSKSRSNSRRPISRRSCKHPGVHKVKTDTGHPRAAFLTPDRKMSSQTPFNPPAQPGKALKNWRYLMWLEQPWKSTEWTRHRWTWLFRCSTWPTTSMSSTCPITRYPRPSHLFTPSKRRETASRPSSTRPRLRPQGNHCKSMHLQELIQTAKKIRWWVLLCLHLKHIATNYCHL